VTVVVSVPYRENGYEDKIKLIRGKLEEVELPVDKVDIIISEWMGYFLLFESMLDTVIFSRDKWLRDPSHVYPNVCRMKLVAVSDETEREARIDFWDNVYGFKMSCMKTEILKEASVQCMEESRVISSTHTLKEFHLTRVTVAELQFEEPFQLTIEQDSLCHAIVGFFEAEFEGPQHCEVLKTGPQSPPTHWKQTVFYLQDPIPVQTGKLLNS
ncbi:Protein arginine N-methyltransferase 3, partial [Geodia barretti]